MRVSRTALILFLALAPLAFSGCNAGIAGIILWLVLSDEDEGGKRPPPPSSLEFVGVQGARAYPSAARIRFLLKNPKSARASVSIEVAPDKTAFVPAALRAPIPGALEGPGRLARLETSPEGVAHSVGWDAAADAGGDAERAVLLRLTVPGSDPLVLEVTVGNEPPEISSFDFVQDHIGEVRFRLVLSDASGDLTDIFAEYAVPGDGDAAFKTCSLLDPQVRLETSPEGTEHDLRWASLADLGPSDGRVAVRLTPLDWVEGVSGKLGTSLLAEICVENNTPPLVRIFEEELLTDPDARGGIAVRFSIEDPESDPADVVLQWAAEGEEFPELSPDLAEAAERARILADPGERAALRIAAIRSEVLEGRVEDPADPLELAANEILASHLKAALELRGLPGEATFGRPLEILGPDGQVAARRAVCRYRPEDGVLELDRPLDPPALPGARVRLDLGGAEGAVRLASSAVGAVHRLIWDVGADAPGGGAFRLRATAYGRADSAGCPAPPDRLPLPPCGGTVPASVETRGAKEILGPYLAEGPETLALLPADRPTDVALGDIDGDGTIDVACSARLSDAVVLFLQRVPGAYDPVRLMDQRLRDPSAIAVRDLDGDARTDIAVAGTGSACVFLVFQRAGGDLFTDRLSLTANGTLREPAALAVEDLDRDGDLDIAVLDAGNAAAPLAIFFRRGAGGLSCGPEEGPYSVCSLADPDGDRGLAGLVAADVFPGGPLELVSASPQGFFKIWSLEAGGGGVTLSSLDVEVPGARLAGVAAADLDGDSLLDLASCDAAGSSLVIVRQEAPGSFAAPRKIFRTGIRQPAKIAAADVDGNSTMDLVAADPGEPTSPYGGAIHVFLGANGLRYSGTSLARPALPGRRSSVPVSVAFGDLERDGSPEIVSADDGSLDLAVYRLSSPGTFPSPPSDVTSGQAVAEAAALIAADLDGDGRTDLVTTNRRTDDLTWYRQVPGGRFAGLRVPLPPAVARSAVQVAGGDVDGDGAADLVTANAATANLTVLYQEPAGGFSLRSDVLQAEGLSGVYSVALADLTGDGRLEVIAAGRFSHDVRWFSRSPEGAWSEPRSLAGGASLRGPIRVAAADLDGDGRADIVTANQLSRNVAVFYQSATRGEFEAAAALALDGTLVPAALALGDVDGDGAADIVAGGLGSPEAIAVIWQEAPRAFRYEGAPGEGAAVLVDIAARDLDRDGRDDVVACFSAWESTVIRVYRWGGDRKLEDARSLRFELFDLVGPAGLTAADLERDGDPDIAAVGSRSRNVLVLYGGR